LLSVQGIFECTVRRIATAAYGRCVAVQVQVSCQLRSLLLLKPLNHHLLL
jgi:hypothetical protein